MKDYFIENPPTGVDEEFDKFCSASENGETSISQYIGYITAGVVVIVNVIMKILNKKLCHFARYKTLST